MEPSLISESASEVHLTPIPEDTVKRSKLLEELLACMLQSATDADAAGDLRVGKPSAADELSAEVPIAPAALHLWLDHVHGSLVLNLGCPGEDFAAGNAWAARTPVDEHPTEISGDVVQRMHMPTSGGTPAGPALAVPPPGQETQSDGTGSAAASRSAGNRGTTAGATVATADVFALMSVRRFSTRLRQM